MDSLYPCSTIVKGYIGKSQGRKGKDFPMEPKFGHSLLIKNFCHNFSGMEAQSSQIRCSGNLRPAKLDWRVTGWFRKDLLGKVITPMQWSNQCHPVNEERMPCGCHHCCITLSGIGGQIRDSAGNGTTPVVTMRIADFINNVVATRR